MRDTISSLELMYLVRELQVVVDSKIDRVYHSKDSPHELILGLHLTGKGKSFIVINLPGMIFLGDEKDKKETPTGLCMMLRKYIEGARIKIIRQQGFERILEIVASTKDESYRIIIELFSKGNIIFTDKDYNVLNLLEEHEFKDRKIKRKERYDFPKSADILGLGEEGFADLVKSSNRESLVKALAIALMLGGTYAEELCASASVEKLKGLDALSIDDSRKLFDAFRSMLNRMPEANLSNGAIYPFVLLTSGPEKTYNSMSDAIKENYVLLKNSKKAQKKEEERQKIQSIISSQERLLEEAKSLYEENQRIAEKIYENYALIDNILQSIKAGRKNMTPKEMKERIDRDNRYASIILDITNEDVILKIGEADDE